MDGDSIKSAEFNQCLEEFLERFKKNCNTFYFAGAICDSDDFISGSEFEELFKRFSKNTSDDCHRFYLLGAHAAYIEMRRQMDRERAFFPPATEVFITEQLADLSHELWYKNEEDC